MRKNNIVVGTRFGTWTVIGEPADMNPGRGRHLYWPCRCDCGTERDVRSTQLIKGRTGSCGCMAIEAITRRATLHGYFGTRLYRIWCKMKQRCLVPTDAGFARYGAKGVKLFDQWKDFIPFKDWALSAGYADNLEIDRIDPAGNYHPTNCRWVTKKVQADNKRNTRYLVAFGERKSLTQWGNDPRCVVGMNTLRTRWYKGWRDETALTTYSRSR